MGAGEEKVRDATWRTEDLMTLITYERVGADGRRRSPFSWRIRYALAHKGIEPEFRHVRFADVETIRALSGQHFVPIVTDGDRVIHDSWNIACYLEDRFPDRPSLFAGSGGRGLARLVNHWSDNTLGAAMRRLIAADFILCLDPADCAFNLTDMPSAQRSKADARHRQESGPWQALVGANDLGSSCPTTDLHDRPREIERVV